MNDINENKDTCNINDLEVAEEQFYVYEYFIVESNEVFYVGKGQGDRAWKDIRNPECEKVKSEYEWNVRIVNEGLSEGDALEIERDLIEKYRKEGQILTNIMPGGVKVTEKEVVGYVKYLLFLAKKDVIQISLSEIANLLLLHNSTVWNIANNEQYSNLTPKIPENINEIIHRYHLNSYSEEQILIGNVKYTLNLIDKGVLKATQAQIAEYFGMTPANVSTIKKEKTHASIPMLVPDSIGDIIKEYDVFYISEEEQLRGMAMFILRMRDDGVLKMTNREIGRILGLSDYIIAEYNRTNEDRKYTTKEYRPSEDIMAKLAPYFVIK